MNRRSFEFTLPIETIRKMNREQYKSAMHLLRLAARIIHNRINWDAFRNRISDVMLYGQSEIRFEDMIN